MTLRRTMSKYRSSRRRSSRRPSNVLVVVAHPRTDSYTHAVARAAVTGIRSAGHQVEVLDLYALGFAPAMSDEEHRAYLTEQPLLDGTTVAHARLAQWADTLVFVYPTWWSGLPAILKGWLDRVLVSGVAFRLDERTGKVRPGLTQVRHIVGISTYGSPRPYVRAVNDNGRRVLCRALRMSCGFRTRRTWLGLYSIDTAGDPDRAGFLRHVETRMAAM